MASRARLTRSIPFWVLFLGSLALTGLGLWLVLDRLGSLSNGIQNQSADPAQQLETALAVYVGPPAATIGGLVLATGIIGLLLTLTVAALASLVPTPAAAANEGIDWTSEDETVADTRATTDADLLPTEDPDVEVPSDAPRAAGTAPGAAPTAH